MATLADVNESLAVLRASGVALEIAAKALYAELSTVKAVPPAAATAADLDALKAQIDTDNAAVQSAITAVAAVSAPVAA